MIENQSPQNSKLRSIDCIKPAFVAALTIWWAGWPALPVGAENDVVYLTQSQIDILHRLTITDQGVGPVKIGMPLDDASQALGFDISSATFQYGDGEYHSHALVTSRNDWTIRFITRNDKIGEIDVFDSAIAPGNGLAIGKPMKEVRSEYAGRYKILPSHEWLDKKISIEGDDEITLNFTGTLLSGQDIEDIANSASPNVIIAETIESITIGLDHVGTVEGCL